MDKICGIYKITSPTERVYIGQSKDIFNRWKAYRYPNSCAKGQPKLQRSLKKYGWEEHTFEIIEECEIEDLNCRERYWQDFYDVLNCGLNCTLTQTDEYPKVLSKDSIEKVIKNSNPLRGENHPCFGKPSPNKGLKLPHLSGENSPHWGKKYTQERKDNISKSKIGKNKGENHPNWGKKYSEEVKEKMSAAMKGKYINGDNHNAKIILDTYSGIFYGSIKEAAIAFNMNYDVLSKRLRGVSKNTTSLIKI